MEDAAARRRRTTALTILLLVCIAWGATFPLMKSAMTAIAGHLPPRASGAEPAVFLALRFALTALLMPLLLFAAPKGARFTRRSFRFAGVLAVLFTGSFYLQVFGLREVAPSISAFVTSLFVVFVPLVVWLFSKRPPSAKLIPAVLISLTGIAFISYSPGTESMLEQPGLLLGIVLSAACALGFAFHIVFTTHATTREDPTVLSVLMIAFAALLSLTVLLFMFGVEGAGEFAASLPAMLSDPAVHQPLAITTLFATVFAVYAWNRWQRELTPSRAAVLYTLEPVFASLISVSLAQEPLRWTLVMGAALVVAANLWCEMSAGKARGPGQASP